ncbi:MAG: tRNA 2-thiouridine(34) synthase MnmA [Brevinematales bacterium]|nr:tRNA 2-thiouridine(34) synthase MnmA [Brevinematales bacterium]
MPSVYIGMSGGIDSSVAAFLIKSAGYEAVGITFVGPEEEGKKKCCSLEEVQNARMVCDFLGIKHKIINLKDIFETKIISYFIESYKKGLTPNPCIYCNRFIKFGALLEYSISEGADFFATGHYARIENFNAELLIKRGIDALKDQSYFISYIEPERLKYIMLPLGNYIKSQIKQIAIDNNLPIDSKRAESQDICFVKDDYRAFLLKKGIDKRKGEFIYKEKIVGYHNGIPFYSFGQRRGLNIALGERIFVKGFDVEKNRIILGEKPVKSQFNVKNLNIFSKNFKDGEYEVQFRYQSRPEKCEVSIKHNVVSVNLKSERELITPGQFAVFYKNDYIYASGEIDLK